MPTRLTLDLPDNDAELLDELATKRGQPPDQTALQLLQRALAKGVRARTHTNQDRTVERVGRQLSLVRYVERHGPPSTEAARQLCRQLGIGRRTLQRDLKIVERTLGRQNGVAEGSESRRLRVET